MLPIIAIATAMNSLLLTEIPLRDLSNCLVPWSLNQHTALLTRTLMSRVHIDIAIPLVG